MSRTLAGPSGPTTRISRRRPVRRGGRGPGLVLATAIVIVGVSTGALVARAAKAPIGTHEPAAQVGRDGLSRDLVADANGTFPLTTAALAMISLPSDQSVSSARPAFGMTQTGSSTGGKFAIADSGNGSSALLGQSNGGGAAVRR